MAGARLLAAEVAEPIDLFLGDERTLNRAATDLTAKEPSLLVMRQSSGFLLEVRRECRDEGLAFSSDVLVDERAFLAVRREGLELLAVGVVQSSSKLFDTTLLALPVSSTVAASGTVVSVASPVAAAPLVALGETSEGFTTLLLRHVAQARVQLPSLLIGKPAQDVVELTDSSPLLFGEALPTLAVAVSTSGLTSLRSIVRAGSATPPSTPLTVLAVLAVVAVRIVDEISTTTEMVVLASSLPSVALPAIVPPAIVPPAIVPPAISIVAWA